MGTEILITLIVTGLWVGLLVFLHWGGEYGMKRAWLAGGLLAAAAGMVIYGDYYGLFVAPPERDMGDVYRIIYVHVPCEWMSFMALTLNFVYSVGYLIRRSERFDALAESTAEVGLLFGATGVLLGSIWARPTWGVWWTTDPRLITAAILVVAYAAYMALRKFVDDPDRRAVWSAVVAILAAADLPLVWFSVKWWASIHQLQSSPQTIPDARMRFSLRFNAVAFLLLFLGFVLMRYRVARATRLAESAPPLVPVAARAT